MKRRFRVTVGGKVFEVEVEEVGVEEVVTMPPPTPIPTTPTHREERRAAPTPIQEAKVETVKARGIVRAPIPGTIVSIKCKEGDSVKAGDPILVLESMKMENMIYSPISGRVKRIYVQEGVSVNAEDMLIEIE
ncbi:MAG: biotin/lipoyl-binding protein [Aigarchaeota archaeon]|nr:biotin/lipoyl-binding protein [Aigarchaeota archaeon]MCX8192890.1 biotin/lipoyl-binding protein [Nitrososphaeria archaeon]MDW7986465.1 biotin/lipoyl-containing protein [Nitrososphaerota archaeon]